MQNISTISRRTSSFTAENRETQIRLNNMRIVGDHEYEEDYDLIRPIHRQDLLTQILSAMYSSTEYGEAAFDVLIDDLDTAIDRFKYDMGIGN